MVHFICLSQRTSDAEHLFMCFMTVSVTSLEKHAFRPLADFLLLLLSFFFFFFKFSCTNNLYVLERKFLWNQPSIFFGRTGAEAPIFWPRDAKN